MLMHALSEDTRVIFEYVQTLFDTFDREFDFIHNHESDSDSEEKEPTFMRKWYERLATDEHKKKRKREQNL